MKRYIAFFRTMPSGLIHILNYSNTHTADYFRNEAEVLESFNEKPKGGIIQHADRLIMIEIDSESLPIGKPIEIDVD